MMNLVFPRICTLCGNYLFASESTLCHHCLRSLPRTQFETYRDNKVEQLFWGRLKLEFGVSIYYFRKSETVQHLMHEIKYRNNRDLATILGKEMGRILKESGLNSSVDCLIPVPLHYDKLRQRGYNQSELIAGGASSVLDIPLGTDILKKARFTTSQTRKARYERWVNVEESFVVNNLSMDGAHFLLVDDVLTTGATLEACGQALLTIPGAKVSIATVAMASD
jgi:ComF family protein